MSRQKQYWPAMARGDESEANVLLTLKRLRREGLIAGFAATAAGDKADRRGVDFWVFMCTPWGLRVEIPLQVKSSHCGIRKHDLQAERLGEEKIQPINGQSAALYDDIVKILGPFLQKLAPRKVNRVVNTGQLRLDFGRGAT